MGKATRSAVRRRLVRDWKESNLTQAEFCRTRGLKARAFNNWVRWSGRHTLDAPVPLVEVVTHDAGPREAGELGWSWELSRDGLVLRGRDCDIAMLETLVAAVARRQ